MDSQARAAQEEALAERLDAHLRLSLGALAGMTVGVYWPIRGEPDLLSLYSHWQRQGALLALPVVDGPGCPLRFVHWRPDDVLQPGLHGVPVPIEDDTHASVSPQVLVIPCVGFDTRGYRLGYGGGYYDRTLARDVPGPRPMLALGVAWSDARLPEFEPLPTDVPLDGVITPQETVTPPR